MKYDGLLVYPKEVQAMLGIGTTKFYELMKLPDFPKPKRLDGRRPLYVRAEIELWVANLN